MLTLCLTVCTNAALAIVAYTIAARSPWGLSVVAMLLVGAYVVLHRQQDLQSKYNNLELLYGFTDRLAGLTEATDVVATALKSVEELLNCRDAELVTRRGSAFERMALHPNGALVHQDDVEAGALEQQVIETGEPVLVSRGQRNPALADDLAKRGWRDAVLVPVRGASSIEGVLLAAERLGETSTFTLADQRLLETLAAHSSVALRGSELLDRLRDEVKARSYEALHDNLTGLGNRKLFRQRLEGTLERSGTKPVAVVMFDLDNFKEINDTLGHHTGDEILREAAERLSRAV
ncbi:MAG: diguanylate cyclase domain-containing protein, partial [Acidimicrobiales bacterium]